MPKTISRNMSDKIQVLRGLAIVSVVLIHSTPLGLAQVWCRPFMNYSVGLFLFLSGFLSDAKRWNPQKRIIKVVIPYMIWSLFYVALNNHRNLSDFLSIYAKNLITGKSAAIMYYIFVYCELTLLIPMIEKLSKSKDKWIGFIISPLEIVVVRLLPLIAGQTFNKYVNTIVDLSCLGWFGYFYLGYLLGNERLKCEASTFKLGVMLAGALILQIMEGYWYLSMGEINCGTQLKLTAILSGALFMLLAYRYIRADSVPQSSIFQVLGDNSFGIYFSHLMIMAFLNKIPYYGLLSIYPLNAVMLISTSLLCVFVGRKVLGRNAKYLAF